MARLPGHIPTGAVCEAPIAGQDIAPTFFSLAGLRLPWEMHGQDITPLLENPETSWNRPILMENTRYCWASDTNVACGEAENGIPWWVSLRQNDYKYIRWLVPGEIEEMYDLNEDPEELVNLALEKEYHGLLAEMRAATIKELDRTGAGMAKNLPPMMVLTKEQLLGEA